MQTDRPLSTKAVERAPRTLQRVHHIEGRHRFPLSVLRVRHAVPDNLVIHRHQPPCSPSGPERKTDTHVLEEDLQDTTRLLVDEAGDTLHTTTTGETADGRLRDT